MTQSNVARAPDVSVNAGFRSVSFCSIRKSSTPCNTRFMRAMDDVVRFFSSPKMRPKKVRGSPPARSTCSIAPSSIPPVPQLGS